MFKVQVLADAMGQILDRKASVAAILQKTVHDLKVMHRKALDHTTSPEDLIFDLFKIPQRDEASIGKLLSVQLFVVSVSSISIVV